MWGKIRALPTVRAQSCKHAKWWAVPTLRHSHRGILHPQIEYLLEEIFVRVAGGEGGFGEIFAAG